MLRTLVAFANTAGGTLVVGRTAEGKVIGVEDVLREEERLANAIAESIRPAMPPTSKLGNPEGSRRRYSL